MKKTLLSLAIVASFGLSGCSTLSELIEKPDDKKTVKEFYRDATTGFEDKQWDVAIENYEKLKAFFPYGAYAEQSYLELAYSYYKYDEPESCIRELDEFIRLYPKHSQLPYAYYLRALAADSVTKSWLDKFVTDPADRDTKSIERAFEYYTQLIQLYPNTDYATAAKDRLVELRNVLARREVMIAKFYMGRQAYLAAANRAKVVLEIYPRAAATADALRIMIEAYDKLGMLENRDTVAKIYSQNKDNIELRTMSIEQMDEVAEQDESFWEKIKSTVSNLF